MPNLKSFIKGLGVAASDNQFYFFYLQKNGTKSAIQVRMSHNGFDFLPTFFSPEIKDKNNRIVNIDGIEEVKTSPLGNSIFFTFIKKKGGKKSLNLGFSQNLVRWKNIAAAPYESGMIVPELLRKDNQFILFLDGEDLRLAYSENLTTWENSPNPILPANYHSIFKIGNFFILEDGLLLLYGEHDTENPNKWQLKALVLDKKDPEMVLWQSDEALWHSPKDWDNKNTNLLGILLIGQKIVSYWELTDGIFALEHPFPLFSKLFHWKTSVVSPVLKKHKSNPLIEPIPENFWESKATFNPAAVTENEKIYLIYRAVGDNDISVLGCSISTDGYNFDQRFSEPIYVPREPFEGRPHDDHKQPFSPYMSGGGEYGGCEDPRITKIDGKFYLTYVAYDGWSEPRIAISSLSEDDFKNHRFDNWSKPKLITRPGIIDKSAAILPEKINGKYVIFHRVFPDILIDYVDSLDFDGQTYLQGQHLISPMIDSWDSRKVGVGPPPIKTEDGWLVIYNAVDDMDDRHYKIGAMVLDPKDPKKVLYRCKSPILVPDQHYENHGLKYGVVYPCGAVVLRGKIIVYYGGSDKYVCAAEANVRKLLRQLKCTGHAQIEPVSIHS